MVDGTDRGVLEGSGLRKSFGAVDALSDVDLTIRAGEILAIVGDNGAGKSTLIKILSGVISPDQGEIRMDGERISFTSPRQARHRGIETVFQDLALAPNRDVVANLFLGRDLYYGGLFGPARVLNTREMRKRAARQLTELDVNIPYLVGVPIGQMSGGQRQAVAIARAAFWASRVMFMDEPTAALGVRESAAVLRLVRRVADQGLGVVMVSHVLPHVLELADRVVVMRHGRKVAELTSEITPERIISLIVGAEAAAYRAQEQPSGEDP